MPVSKQIPKEPSLLARYTCAGISCAVFSVWWKLAFVPENQTPGVDVPMHSWRVPLCLTVGYLISLPILRSLTNKYLSGVDVKILLKESMLLYNVSQVAINGWMVWRFVDAVVNKNHPWIGDISYTQAGTCYAVWIHYCDKYLEFFDTYFMVLRGRMDQVSFLHVYHHFSIAWGWWVAMSIFPGGDAYFGALFNSWIHVLMYSYYALALLKIPCPWKKYLTQAQLLQFTCVVIYTFAGVFFKWPRDQIDGRHYLCAAVQVWEMVSLFVLFSFFYMRSYNKKQSTKKANDEDQCQMAVAEGVHGAAQAVESAAKNANKFASSVKKGSTTHQTVRPM